MNSIQEIRDLLKEKKPYLSNKYGVRALSIFGSAARGDGTDASDVDILVEFERPIGLEFVDLADELEQLLGARVDLVSKNGIKNKYLHQIESDLIDV